jgi:hypothetical protein
MFKIIFSLKCHYLVKTLKTNPKEKRSRTTFLTLFCWTYTDAFAQTIDSHMHPLTLIITFYLTLSMALEVCTVAIDCDHRSLVSTATAAAHII